MGVDLNYTRVIIRERKRRNYMQSFIAVMVFASFVVGYIAKNFSFGGTHSFDVFLIGMGVIAVAFFIARNIGSAFGISVLIASAVTVFGVYFGTLPQNTWLEATLFLSVWILIPTNILPGIIRLVPRIAGLAFSKKAHA